AHAGLAAHRRHRLADRRHRGRQGGHPPRSGRPRRAARHVLERPQRRPRRPAPRPALRGQEGGRPDPPHLGRRSLTVNGPLIVALVFASLALVIFLKTAIVVPQKSAYVVENLGRYSKTLEAGFHILVPFLAVSPYRHSLEADAARVHTQH